MVERHRITSRISIPYPDVFYGTQIRSEVSAPPGIKVTTGTPCEFYRYHFAVGDKVVAKGASDDLTTIERELLQRYPRGRLIKIGRVRKETV